MHLTNKQIFAAMKAWHKPIKPNGADIREMLVHEHKGACAHCGYKGTYALDFHHLNPNLKSFELNALELSKHSLNLIKAEAQKCILLCKNCHWTLHKSKKLDPIKASPP